MSPAQAGALVTSDTGAMTRIVPEVVLLCGIAGSGKTTFAQRLEQDGYLRLAIDEEIWERFGRYGIDYEANEYAQRALLAEASLREKLIFGIGLGRNIVIDKAFWNRATRDAYRKLISDAGGACRLVYLKAEPELLRKRLAQRAERFDANAAFPITDQTLAMYLRVFEEPRGEGEEVILVADDKDG